MFFYLPIFLNRNIAIIINTSKDYNNYRHTSNSLLLAHILKQENKNFNTILTLTNDQILKNNRNTSKDYFYISKQKKLKANINLTSISSSKILSILSGNHIMLRSIDIDTNILIYICGHGGDGFLKILDREYLLKYDLTTSIVILSKKVNKVLVIVDTCQAQSIIDCSLLLLNTGIVFTSKNGEPSVSNVTSCEVGFNVIDGFMDVFCEVYVDGLNMWIEDFVNLFSYDKVGSTVQFFGTEKCFTLNEFFFSEDMIDESKIEL